jgi:hypothetical protein
MSEHAAYGRIEAARAARRWPSLLELLADGALHLTTVTLLSRHLTEENHAVLFAAARHKTKREVEEIVAALQPQPAVASMVRKLPTPPGMTIPVTSLIQERAETDEAPNIGSDTDAIDEPGRQKPASQKRRAEVTPLAPERYKLQCTVSRETYDKLRQAQDLLRHRIPDGDIGTIVDRALTLLLGELHKTKHAAVDRPRVGQPRVAHRRHVPAGVKRVVWERDKGRCAFKGAAGRCTEQGFLEYHHVIPFADGGSTTADNLELRCRAHNAHEAQRWSGMAERDSLR